MNFFGWKLNFSRGHPKLPREIVEAAALKLARMNMVPDGRGGIRSAGQQMVDGLNQNMTRAYDGAINTNYNQGWRNTYGSSDSEIQSSLYPVRARTRTICKDTPHGKAIIRAYQNNVVGHRGFRLKSRVGKRSKTGKFTPDEDLNHQLEDIYFDAGLPENFTVTGDVSRMAALRIFVASAVRDGFIMGRHWRGFPNNDFGYAIQLLEADRLQDSYMGRAPNTNNEIRFSCELDMWKRKVAYWILERHPGDPFCGAPLMNSNTWRERVPADEIILYGNMADRAEQTVGFPELDSVIQHMFRDAQYETAMTLAAIASCCKPYWLKKLFPTGMTFTSDDKDAFLDYINQVSEAMVDGPQGTNGVGRNSGTIPRREGVIPRSSTEMPAATRELNYGEELMQLDPKFPVEAASSFKRDNMHAVGAGAGTGFQLTSGDYQNLGFSATRAMAIPTQDNFKMWQQNMIDMVIRVEYKERVRAAIMCGMLHAPMERLKEICRSATFIGVRWPFVNPLQDIQASILQLEAGLVSRQQLLDEMEDGGSIEDLYAMLEEDQDCQELHGLDLDSEDVDKPSVEQGEPLSGQPKPTEAPKASVTKTTNPNNRSRFRRKRGIAPQVMEMIAGQGDGRNGFHG
jgi:lambda family phage portal protein